MHAIEASRSLLILGGEGTERLVTAALNELNVQVDRIEEREEFGGARRSANLVILERGRLEGPETVNEWLEDDVLDSTVPLLLFAPSPVDSAQHREWLGAGVWDTVRLPIDPAILALRLRNLLGVRWEENHAPLVQNRPYPWPTLVQATGEVLALGHRHGRPVSCLAIAVGELRHDPADRGDSPRLMYRLGATAREWVRDSDLVGVTEQDVLLAVLPDTPFGEAQNLAPRLIAALERSLKTAGTVAPLRSAIREGSLQETESASEFLLSAVREVI